jgi:hypothetical protein
LGGGQCGGQRDRYDSNLERFTRLLAGNFRAACQGRGLNPAGIRKSLAAHRALASSSALSVTAATPKALVGVLKSTSTG